MCYARTNIWYTTQQSRFLHTKRWEFEHPAFLEVCKALPSDRLDYRPHTASRSAGELVALFVSLELGCVELCESGRGSYNSTLRFHPKAGSATLEEMIAAYQDHHHALSRKLSQMDD